MRTLRWQVQPRKTCEPINLPQTAFAPVRKRKQKKHQGKIKISNCQGSISVANWELTRLFSRETEREREREREITAGAGDIVFRLTFLTIWGMREMT